MKSYVYPAATSTARALIRYIIDMMNREPERIFYLAFSGGTTPSLMFDIWAHEFREETPWMRMRIFWVDERCSPAQEAKRYSDLVSSTVPLRRGFPTFDIVLLGAGDDGHTSSIFPGQEYLLSSFHPYEKSINPYNGQPRIAMTGCLLFSARKLIFLITGKNKTEVVYDILKSGDTGPAAYVAHHAADVDIFTDIEIDG